MRKTELLNILDDKVKSCQRCDLAEGRTNTVFGEGNPFCYN